VIQHRNAGLTERVVRYLRSAIALLCGCQSALDPALPQGAQAMMPPPVYATWWAMTSACSGLSGPLDRVEWYQVPGAATVPYPGVSDANGYWSFASDRIVLAGESVLDGGAVRHEMLHALLQTGRHPRAAFLERCAGFVDCGRECIADSDPLPPLDPATPTISPDQLTLTTSVAPPTPSMGVDGGFFAVTVAVTNASDRARGALPRPRRSRACVDSRGDARGDARARSDDSSVRREVDGGHRGAVDGADLVRAADDRTGRWYYADHRHRGTTGARPTPVTSTPLAPSSTVAKLGCALVAEADDPRRRCDPAPPSHVEPADFETA
jgi:hypothetical protein